MAMNRETKRMLKRQGNLDEEGKPKPAQRSAAPRPVPVSERTSPRQWAQEVRGELRRVVWPSRDEVINYSMIVLAAVVLLTALIAGLDAGVSQVVLALFDQ